MVNVYSRRGAVLNVLHGPPSSANQECNKLGFALQVLYDRRRRATATDCGSRRGLNRVGVRGVGGGDGVGFGVGIGIGIGIGRNGRPGRRRLGVHYVVVCPDRRLADHVLDQHNGCFHVLSRAAYVGNAVLVSFHAVLIDPNLGARRQHEFSDP